MFSKVVEQRRKEAGERLFLQSWRHGCKAKQCGELCGSSRKHCFLIGRFMSSFMRNHHYFMGQWLIKISVFCIVIFSQSECTVEVMDQWSAQLMNWSRTMVNSKSTILFSILKFKIILHYNERNIANFPSFLPFSFLFLPFAPLINENPFCVILCLNADSYLSKPCPVQPQQKNNMFNGRITSRETSKFSLILNIYINLVESSKKLIWIFSKAAQPSRNSK